MHIGQDSLGKASFVVQSWQRTYSYKYVGFVVQVFKRKRKFNIIITINSPLLYIGRGIIILLREKAITRAISRGSP